MNAIDRDDTAQKIAAIREALDAATPGPWENVRLFYVGVTTEGRFYPVAECDDQNNAILIANAPEWLRFLLGELKKITEQRDAYYNNARYTEAAAHGIKKLREENRKMIEALRWYAKLNPAYTGHLARDTLREIGVTVE